MPHHNLPRAGPYNACLVIPWKNLTPTDPIATVETVWSYLKKLKMELPCDPVILLLGIYLKKPKTLIEKYMHSLPHYVQCSIIYNSQDIETT